MEALRKAFDTKFPDPRQFDECDVRRLHDDDALANAYLAANDDSVEEALQQVEKSFIFRREMSLNTITEASFPIELRQKGSVFYHSHDKKGNKILYFRIRDNSRKEAAVVAAVKQYVAFLINQEHCKDASQQLVMLFDMTGAGLSNFDADLIRFIITCFDTHFPRFLAYLLVFDMPFILNAAWKLIRNWLSEKAREKVIFVKRSNITDYIAREQLWSHMGGLDSYEYVYEPPQDELDSSIDMAAVEESSECRRRPSRISDTDSQPHSLNSSANHMQPSFHYSAATVSQRLVVVTPGDVLHFPPGEVTRTITLRNSQSAPVAFKVNTTRPQDFRVRPSSGLMSPHERAEVTVALKTAAGGQSQAGSARFQILALQVAADTNKEAALNQLKAAGKDVLFEARLGCVMGNKPPPPLPDITLTSVSRQVEELEKQQRQVHARLDNLHGLLRLLCYLAAAVLLLQLLLLLRPSSPCRS